MLRCNGKARTCSKGEQHGLELERLPPEPRPLVVRDEGRAHTHRKRLNSALDGGLRLDVVGLLYFRAAPFCRGGHVKYGPRVPG